MREALIRPELISGNVAALHHAADAPEAMLVVKGDGYGHGLVTAARAGLDARATWLGTADIDEAMALRGADIDAPVLAWLIWPDQDLSDAVDQRVSLGLSSVGQLDQVVAVGSATTTPRIHLEVDSGMGRGGVVESDWEEMLQRTAQEVRRGALVLEGVLTHLSLKSAESDSTQLERFDRFLALLDSHNLQPEVIHSGASVGALRTPHAADTFARFGISAYGFALTPEHESLGLRPAMRVSGQVITTKRLPQGHGVGYDLTYQTSAETTMAVIPLGYADGIPRQASHAGPVSIGGTRFLVAGRVSMDQISVDVGDHPVSVGDWAVLWGDPAEGHPSAAEWAEAAGTIPYEIVSLLGSRVPRVVQ